jgi:drug/metabolite transporter (DMT)-like permease
MTDAPIRTAPGSMLAPQVLLPFLAVTLIWGSTWIVIKDQLGVVPPSWSVTWRFLLGGITMLGAAFATRTSLRLDARGWRFVVLLGISQFVLNFNFVYRAEQSVTSGLVAVVFALLFLPNAILSRLFLGTRISARFIAGSAISIIGIALLFLNEARSDPRNLHETLTGIGFTLLGVMSASTANVMQATEQARKLPMATMLGWAMVSGAALDAILAWALSGPPQFEWRLGYFAGVGYLGVVASALAFSLYFRSIREIGPAKAAYSSVIIPVLAMGYSTVLEGFEWTALAAWGSATALAGMLVALSRKRNG